MAKTFIIRPTSLVQGGTPYYDVQFVPQPPDSGAWIQDSTGGSPHTILDCILSQTWVNIFQAAVSADTVTVSFSDVLRFIFSGNCIYLDGSLTPISFSALPAGFIATSASVKIDPSILPEVNLGGSSHYYLQQANGFAGVVDTPSYPYANPDIVNILSFGCGLEVHILNIPAVSQGNVVLIFNLRVEGTYSIGATRFTLQNSTTPVRAGDKVKVTSLTGGLDGVAQIVISDPTTGLSVTIDAGSYYIILQQPDMFWFYIPFDFVGDDDLITIELIGDGVEFSGSVDLGTLQLLSEDATGIYELVKGQTNDIIYTRDGYTTDPSLLMLPDMMENELYYDNDDFFSLLRYPYQILSSEDYQDDIDQSDFSITSSARFVIVPLNVEIPSPFIKTAFLP